MVGNSTVASSSQANIGRVKSQYTSSGFYKNGRLLPPGATEEG